METNETTEKKAPPIKPEITIDEFMKADVRLCQIISVEKIEKRDKLYKLTIDTGLDHRVVVSAIAKMFTPEELIGKCLPFVLNLPVRNIAGIDSNGMIILAESFGNMLQVTSTGSNQGLGAILI